MTVKDQGMHICLGTFRPPSQMMRDSTGSYGLRECLPSVISLGEASFRRASNRANCPELQRRH